MTERRTVPVQLPVIEVHECSLDVRQAAIARAPMFRGLTAAQVAEVEERCGAHGMLEDEAIYLRGQPAERMYFVAHGIVKITRDSAEGRQTLLDVRTPGDFFGAIPELGFESYVENAWGMTDGCILMLDAADYAKVMRDYPDVALATVKVLGDRLAKAQTSVHLLSGAALQQRLAAVLLGLGAKVGRRWEDGILLQIPIGRDDLAAMAGAATESVSRQLSAWKKAGIIDSGRRWIAITDPAALRELRGS
ncbi:MAG: Crp/Fnr family transcriptional regulator [Propionibacterium sp.]|nr:Crp/Fnr family transcriptional regulator [Propionibacterium sp.]